MIGLSFERFEHIILDGFFIKYPDYAGVLAWQYGEARVKKRVFTDYGFYTEYVVSEDAVTLGPHADFTLGGVELKINGIKTPAVFRLTVRSGRIFILEGELVPWPRIIEKVAYCDDRGEK